MEWWKFNGYGFYVWGSYLCALAVVVIEIAEMQPRHGQRRPVMHAQHRLRGGRPRARP